MEPSGRVEGLVRVLGGVEARASAGEGWVGLAPQQRLVLALLVSRLGRPCRLDWLVGALWGERAPANPARLVQALMSRLRGVLDPPGGAGSRLRAVAGGWQLDLDPDVVDVAWFRGLADRVEALARRGEPVAARGDLEAAVGLWRGRPFGELADHPLLAAETRRLEERRLSLREQLLALRLEAGEREEVVADLYELAGEHPLRERIWELLLRALWQSGRQADALVAYQQLRDRLVEELGTQPGPPLQRLHTAILRHELPTPSSGEALLAPSGHASPPAADEASPAAGASPGRRRVRSWPCQRQTPVVGRAGELDTLRQTLSGAREGKGGMVLVSGEPGIGKTRLAAELADAAADDGMEVLVGRCRDGAAVPYEPVVEALRADVEAVADEALAGRLGRDAGELARLLPELAPRTGRAPAASVSAELDQHRLFEAVADWLQTAAAQRPLTFVVEDAHAATRSTLLLLHHLVERTSVSPLLLVVTYRDTADQRCAELDDTVAALARRPEVVCLSLAGLDTPAVGELLAGWDKAFTDDGWAEAIQAATAGNPLFVEELLAALDDECPADPEDLRRHPTAPQGVRQLLATRMRRLSAVAVELLQHAAVAGDDFVFAEVAQATGLSEADALAAVEEATAARLVTESDPGDDRHRFRHAVMRAALLDSTTASYRMRLHARLARAIEACHRDDPTRVASRLAYHDTAAGPAVDSATARHHLVAAGEAAMAQRAYTQAVAHYHQAWQRLNPAADATERCELSIRLGEAQSRAGQPAHRATLLAAGRLAIDLADPERVARAALAGNRGFLSQFSGTDGDRVALLQDALAVASAEHPGSRALLLALLAHELVFAPDLTRRRRLTDEALALADRDQDPVVRARVLALRWVAIQHPATLDERLAATGELVDLAGRLDDPFVATLAHTSWFVDLLEAGDAAGADTAATEALRCADELAHPVLAAFVSSLDAGRELLWGDLDRAEHLAEGYRAQGQQAGAADIDCPYLAQQFLLHRERGQLADYRPLLDQALEAYGMAPAWQALATVVWWHTGDEDRALGTLDCYAADDFARVPHDGWWAHTMCLFAEVAALAGRRKTAQCLLGLLAPYHDHLVIEVSVPLGAMAYYLGLLATTVDDWPRAHAYLDRAATIHHRLDAGRWHNHTLLAQARLHTRRNNPGDHAEASRLLHTACSHARKHGQTALVNEAEQLGAGV